MHGLRAENHAQTTSAEGPSSIRIARGTPFWTGNRRADWKVASRFVNMGRLLLLGAYPSGAYMGNPGSRLLTPLFPRTRRSRQFGRRDACDELWTLPTRMGRLQQKTHQASNMRSIHPFRSHDGILGRCFSLGVILLVLLNSGAHAKNPVDTDAQKANLSKVFADFEIVPDVVYKTVGGRALELDLLIPKNLPKTPAPLLVHIHGGGWGGGDRYILTLRDHALVIKRCGKAGIICATIEYRLTDGKATVYDSVVDCKNALRYLVKNATKHHIDANRIATFGGSAGGHLSLMTALGDPKEFPGDPALTSYDPASLRAEVAFYPATDFTDPALAKRHLTPSRATLLFGGTAQEKGGFGAIT